ncbi:MAG: cytidylate kinase-like family protein [Deltaproteobacteria bacterium]|nr:cytidylate kinase-like family protein [Deltaproteobacteria bacterium]
MTTHLCIHGEVFTKTQKIVGWIVSRTGWPIVSDRDLIEAAGQRFNVKADRLERFMKSPDGMLNRLTHGTERAMAYINSVLVEKLGEGTTVFHGSRGLPTTRQLPQVLNVLVTAEPRFRVQRALDATTANERQARTIIDRRDRREFQWCRHVFGGDPFDANAYDLVVPSDRLDTETAGRLILEQLMQTEMAARDNESDLLNDLKLASKIQVLLSEGGYPVSVTAQKGHIRLTVDRPVLLLDRLNKKLERRILQIEGVQQVETRAGRYFFQADIYRRCRFELPSEALFRSFTRCRRRLHDQAAANFPVLTQRQEQGNRIQAVQQL